VYVEKAAFCQVVNTMIQGSLEKDANKLASRYPSALGYFSKNNRLTSTSAKDCLEKLGMYKHATVNDKKVDGKTVKYVFFGLKFSQAFVDKARSHVSDPPPPAIQQPAASVNMTESAEQVSVSQESGGAALPPSRGGVPPALLSTKRRSHTCDNDGASPSADDWVESVFLSDKKQRTE
jgi:hypothetical protein